MKTDNLFYLKIVELVITVICVILVEVSAGITYYGMLVYGTLVAYTIICSVILVGNILDAELDKNMNGLFSIIGCILFITGGALIISEWANRSVYYSETRDRALATGALMIINGIVFLADGILIFKK